MTRKSIRTWLITPLILLFIVPLVLFGTVFSWQNYEIEKEQVERLQKKLTVLAAENMSAFIHEHELIIQSMLRTNYLPGMSRTQQKELLAKFLTSVRNEKHGAVFNTISLLDNQGKEVLLVSRTELEKEEDLGSRSGADEFLIPVKTGAFYYGPVNFDEKTGEPFIRMSVPIRDLQTQVIKWVLITEMKLSFMWDLVAEMKIGTKGAAYITDLSGRVVVHPNLSLVLKNTYFKAPALPTVMPGILGERAVIAAEKISIGDQALFFVTETPAAEAFAHIHRSILLVGIFIFVILAGAIALGIIVARQIIAPLEALAGTATKISAGDFSQHAEAKRMDELGELALAFNTMTDKLVASIKDLEKEKNFVRNTIESLSHPFYVIDANDYTIILANSAANVSFAEEGNTCYELTHNSDRPCEGADHPCVIKEIKKSKKPVAVEHVHRTAGGPPRTYEVYGYPIFDDQGEVSQVIEYNIDITEKKGLEAQLMQSQKLEAVGILTGGVAHDFNNLLTTIIGYSELAMMNMAQEDPLREQIETIYGAGNRAADLTRQLLAFSRKQVMEIKVINLNTIINNMVKMLNRLIGEHIEMKTRLDSSIGNIKADPGQVEQILMNLTVNAKDAMPEGGKLFVETATTWLDEKYCRKHVDITPGPYVSLSISDTGVGIDPEVKDKIFDPFFTTKERGAGTGLGLATVYGIIKQLKGQIVVYSELDNGTTFKIFFPQVEEEAVEESRVKGEVVAGQEGTETVLVVDDEKSIRQLVADTLEPLGYHVIIAASGEDALNILKKLERPVDLLITDVIMPGMHGKELADKLHEFQPDTRVLYMSGYTDDVITTKGVLGPGMLFLNKPLVPSILSKKIREIFDEK